ncbi:MAG: hypothetical protein ACKOK8_00760, partial [Planctomycetia bacterium]
MPWPQRPPQQLTELTKAADPAAAKQTKAADPAAAKQTKAADPAAATDEAAVGAAEHFQPHEQQPIQLV